MKSLNHWHNSAIRDAFVQTMQQCVPAERPDQPRRENGRYGQDKEIEAGAADRGCHGTQVDLAEQQSEETDAVSDSNAAAGKPAAQHATSAHRSRSVRILVPGIINT